MSKFLQPGRLQAKRQWRGRRRKIARLGGVEAGLREPREWAFGVVHAGGAVGSTRLPAVGQSRVTCARLRPIPARQAFPKLSDAERWLLEFRFHEAAVRDLRQPAKSGRSPATAFLPHAAVAARPDTSSARSTRQSEHRRADLSSADRDGARQASASARQRRVRASGTPPRSGQVRHGPTRHRTQ